MSAYNTARVYEDVVNLKKLERLIYSSNSKVAETINYDCIAITPHYTNFPERISDDILIDLTSKHSLIQIKRRNTLTYKSLYKLNILENIKEQATRLKKIDIESAEDTGIYKPVKDCTINRMLSFMEQFIQIIYDEYGRSLPIPELSQLGDCSIDIIWSDSFLTVGFNIPEEPERQIQFCVLNQIRTIQNYGYIGEPKDDKNLCLHIADNVLSIPTSR